jgi:bile acid-coenzyme A ligase
LMQPRLLVKASHEGGENLPVSIVVGNADAAGHEDSSPMKSEVAPVWKISTSGGSTGRPKLIIHDSASSFDPDTDRIFDEFKMPPDGVVLNPGPLYHNAPFLFSSYGLFTGSTVIGMDRFDAEEALSLIEKYQVNWVCFVPTMMHRIWSLPRETRERYDVSSLKAVWHMASVCPAWLKEAWIDWLGPERIWVPKALVVPRSAGTSG